jgi:hypothetical protein
MGGHKIDRATVQLDLCAEHTATFGLAPVFKHSMYRFLNGEARKNGHAVFAALIVKVWSEGELHSGQGREFCDLIFVLRASNVPVDLLQSNQIGTLLIDDAGDALQVELLVHPDADVNVVSHHANSPLRGPSDRRGGPKKDHGKDEDHGDSHDHVNHFVLDISMRNLCSVL